ncbi:MAG: hypothetical protein WCH09_05885 [Bacteroidota bacterium]
MQTKIKSTSNFKEINKIAVVFLQTDFGMNRVYRIDSIFMSGMAGLVCILGASGRRHAF